jgi:hypothetical protein
VVILQKRIMTRTALLLWLPATLVSMCAAASDFNPLGFYIGGTVGRSDVRTTVNHFSPHDFDQRDTGWKVFVGLRPNHWIAAELTYVDFGHPTQSTNPDGIVFSHADALQRAETLSGLVFAPIPLPLLDVYARIGIARLHSSGSETIQCRICFAALIPFAPLRLNQTNTDLQYGGGLQVKLSALTARLEYERIKDGRGDPDLLSAGVTWTF